MTEVMILSNPAHVSEVEAMIAMSSSVNTDAAERCLAYRDGAAMIALLLQISSMQAGEKGCSTIDSIMEGQGVTDRETYLAFRHALKLQIRMRASHQKLQRALCFEPGRRSEAMSRRHNMKWRITCLIALRRAAKLWSAGEAKAVRAAAIAA